MNFFHVVADESAHSVNLALGDFEDQLVVHLQGHARLETLLAKGGVDANHGDLDQVRRSSLQWRVDGSSLGKAALIGILRVDVGNGANAAEERFHFLVATSLLKG